MASPFPPRTLVFKIVTCTVFVMVHNTAYPTPSGYDARKHVKFLRPVVYMIFPASHAKKNKPKTLDHMRDQQELASWLSSPDLRNFHHFEFESAERKQKFIEGKEDFLSVPAFPWKNTRMPFLVFIHFGCHSFQKNFSFIFKDYLMPITWWLFKVYMVSFLSFLWGL